MRSSPTDTNLVNWWRNYFLLMSIRIFMVAQRFRTVDGVSFDHVGQNQSCLWLHGERTFELVKSFAHRRISNMIFGRCRHSDFLQTFTVKHYHNILTFFLVSEWNLAITWSNSRLKYAKTQSFLLLLSLFANHKYCVTVLVMSLISSLFLWTLDLASHGVWTKPGRSAESWKKF